MVGVGVGWAVIGRIIFWALKEEAKTSPNQMQIGCGVHATLRVLST